MYNSGNNDRLTNDLKHGIEKLEEMIDCCLKSNELLIIPKIQSIPCPNVVLWKKK